MQQNPDAQLVTDTVWHELSFGLENLGTPQSAMRRIAAETASYFGISELYHAKTDQLSGGQKQLVNLAALYAMRPRLLLLDEPTAQLDPIAAHSFLATIKRLHQELGTTIVLVEHALEQVFSMCDEVVVLDRGVISLQAPPREAAQSLYALPAFSAIRDALPVAVRTFSGAQTPCPMDVREGRRALTRRLSDEGAPGQEPVVLLPDAPICLEAREVDFQFEKNAPFVLSRCTLSVRSGECLSLVGSNGAGKSTLLRILAGIHPPVHGKVLLEGKPLKKTGHPALAYLPQNPQLLFSEDTLEADYRLLQTAFSLPEERVCQVVQNLQLEPLLSRHPLDLSGGEQQRAAFGKLLLRSPSVLLLDEPTKGLDAAARKALGVLLRTLCADGKTVILATHDLEFAACYADRCAYLFDGEVISTEPARAFFLSNHLYTTAVRRMTEGILSDAVTCEDLAWIRPGVRT